MSSTQNQVSQIRTAVRGFLERQFPAAVQRGIGDDDSLLDSGVIDSLGVLELVDFIEAEFQIALSDEEMLAENFESISSIATFIELKQRAEGASSTT